jgi:hypothetical protein
MLAAASELGLLACFLTILTTVLPVGTTLLDHALATWVSAFFRLSHNAPFGLCPQLPWTSDHSGAQGRNLSAQTVEVSLRLRLPYARRVLQASAGGLSVWTMTPVEETPSAELIAIVTGSYYGDKTGHSFSLRRSQHPDRSVSIKVWYYASDGPFFYASRHRLQVERLALEVIRQMDAL